MLSRIPLAERLATGLLVAAGFASPIGARAQTIAPNDNLVVEGIPPIPASLAEETARYTEARSAGFWGWHPAKKEMLIGTRFGNVNQAHTVAMPGGARRQLTFFPERILGARYDERDGTTMVFAKDVGGSEFAQLFRYDLATGDVTLLTDGKSRNNLGTWSTRGDRMAYTSTRRNGRDTDIYVIDPRTPTSDRLVAQVDGGGWFPLDWSPDDTKLLVIEYVSVNESYLWLVDVASGAKTALTPRRQGQPVSYGYAEFLPDGKTLIVTSDEGSELQRIARFDLATRRAQPLIAMQGDIEGVDVSPNGRLIAFETNERGASVLRVADASSGRVLQEPKLPLGSMGGLDWHADSHTVGFSLSSARSPSDAYSLDVETGEITRWTFSELGGLAPEQLQEPRMISWKSFDGREITGFMYSPPASFTGKRPVIVSIHGGPEGQSRPTFLGRNNYYLNELGVALIYPNVRGSTGFGKTFAKLDNDTLRAGTYKDIAALFDWIATQPGLDASKIMVMGGSYGGHMVLATATNYPDRIAAAVDVVGISHLATFLENTESYRRDLRRAEYGDERKPEIRAWMDRTAPLNNASKITKPLLVVQGANDPRVPRSEAEQIVAAVRKNGTPVWYLLGKNEGHGFSKKENADFQFYATVMFIREHLLDAAARTAMQP